MPPTTLSTTTSATIAYDDITLALKIDTVDVVGSVFDTTTDRLQTTAGLKSDGVLNQCYKCMKWKTKRIRRQTNQSPRDDTTINDTTINERCRVKRALGQRNKV